MDVVCTCGHIHQCRPITPSPDMSATWLEPIPKPPTVVMTQAEFRRFLINGGLSPAEAGKLCESVENQTV